MSFAFDPRIDLDYMVGELDISNPPSFDVQFDYRLPLEDALHYFARVCPSSYPDIRRAEITEPDEKGHLPFNSGTVTISSDRKPFEHWNKPAIHFTLTAQPGMTIEDMRKFYFLAAASSIVWDKPS